MRGREKMDRHKVSGQTRRCREGMGREGRADPKGGAAEHVEHP